MNINQKYYNIAELKVTDIEAALNIVNAAFETDPTLCWYLSADTAGYSERRYNYFKSYLTFHHQASMPALGVWFHGDLVGVSYFTPPSHPVDPSIYSELGRSIRAGCGEESLARIDLLIETVDHELSGQNVAKIEFIAIVQKNQGLGFGGKLLTSTIVNLKGNNCKAEVFLETGEKRNLPLYSRHGFTIYKTIALPNLNQYLMRLTPNTILG